MKKELEFDEDGYQKNLTELNGEPLPDISDLKFVSREELGLPSAAEFRRMRLEREHGGTRAGAGRKPSGRVQYVTRLRPTLIKRIKLMAKKARKDECEVIETLLKKAFA